MKAKSSKSLLKTWKVKRIFRIMFGSIIVLFPFLISSWIWLWQENQPYRNVLELSWYLMSGQWNKLPY